MGEPGERGVGPPVLVEVPGRGGGLDPDIGLRRVGVPGGAASPLSFASSGV